MHVRNGGVKNTVRPRAEDRARGVGGGGSGEKAESGVEWDGRQTTIIGTEQW
jgi:hypothetical protein